MERPLTEWERGVITALASVDAPGGERVRESLPHLVVTGGCECGCRSFNVRDVRFPPDNTGSSHFSNGWTPDRQNQFFLLLDESGRPQSVDDLPQSEDPASDFESSTLIVEAAT